MFWQTSFSNIFLYHDDLEIGYIPNSREGARWASSGPSQKAYSVHRRPWAYGRMLAAKIRWTALYTWPHWTVFFTLLGPNVLTDWMKFGSGGSFSYLNILHTLSSQIFASTWKECLSFTHHQADPPNPSDLSINDKYSGRPSLLPWLGPLPKAS